MAITASNPCVLYRDFGYREQPSSPSSAASAASSCGGGGSLATSGYSLAWRGVCLRRRGDLRAGAFWISKPSSVEMEEIAGMEEMDEVLRRSKELSQPVIIDWWKQRNKHSLHLMTYWKILINLAG